MKHDRGLWRRSVHDHVVEHATCGLRAALRTGTGWRGDRRATLLERTLSRPWSPARLESSDAESPSPAQDEGGRKLEVELSARRWTGPTSDAREDPRQAGRRGPELREEPVWPPPRSSQPQEAAMDQCPSRPEQTPRSGEHCHRDTGDSDAGLRDEQEECAERIPDLASELAEAVGEGRSTRRRGRAGGRGHGRESASQLTFFPTVAVNRPVNPLISSELIFR
jgi:hypothetical protein